MAGRPPVVRRTPVERTFQAGDARIRAHVDAASCQRHSVESQGAARDPRTLATSRCGSPFEAAPPLDRSSVVCASDGDKKPQRALPFVCPPTCALLRQSAVLSWSARARSVGRNDTTFEGPPMSLRRSLLLAATAATPWFRLHDVQRPLLRARPRSADGVPRRRVRDNLKLWPAAQLPDLRPMRTQLIPDRRPPRGVEPIGWPPL